LSCPRCCSCCRRRLDAISTSDGGDGIEILSVLFVVEREKSDVATMNTSPPLLCLLVWKAVGIKKDSAGLIVIITIVIIVVETSRTTHHIVPRIHLIVIMKTFRFCVFIRIVVQQPL
jgi:hypothetical protein